MFAISRFSVPDERASDFRARAEAAVSFFTGCRGCQGAWLLQNLDEPTLWTITSQWADVGSYRRSFNGYEAKMVLVSLLSEAIDEPSAYATPEEVGDNLPRSLFLDPLRGSRQGSAGSPAGASESDFV